MIFEDIINMILDYITKMVALMIFDSFNNHILDYCNKNPINHAWW